MLIKDKIKWRYHQFLKRHYPFFWSKHLYKNNLGRTTKFKDPKDLNEKIQWLMFFTDTASWTMLADKYAVRQYVKERIGENYLIPLIGKWDRAEDINFEELPDKFVIKPNNGSYDTVICRNKKDANIEEIRKKMAYSLTHKFGYEHAEPHYLRIRPCIVAEVLLESDAAGGLIDYKVWCFNGKPHCIFVCANRDNEHHHTDFVYYDLDWQKHSECLTEEFRNSFNCPRPENLEELLVIASKLSQGFPQVRVDLYIVHGKIYFGEMTLSSNFGMMPYLSPDALVEMGKQVQLPKRSAQEIMSTFFKRWLPTF